MGKREGYKGGSMDQGGVEGECDEAHCYKLPNNYLKNVMLRKIISLIFKYLLD